MQQDTDHAYLIGEAVRGEGAILVDHQGKRFINELSTRKIVSGMKQLKRIVMKNLDVRLVWLV